MDSPAGSVTIRDWVKEVTDQKKWAQLLQARWGGGCAGTRLFTQEHFRELLQRGIGSGTRTLEHKSVESVSQLGARPWHVSWVQQNQRLWTGCPSQGPDCLSLKHPHAKSWVTSWVGTIFRSEWS